jgi:hypothetical protein
MDKLYFLDQDGSELRGIVIDDVSGYIYWTNMGRDFKHPQGSIERAMNLDGNGRQAIVRGAGRLTGICYHRGHD